ncbi:MAG: LysM peptidoglycan-binding domain-containing protein, partial [Alistipes sp.]|nr:LysM peptidoglycan-binding domain-containing protein [Alistipes sp.]
YLKEYINPANIDKKRAEMNSVVIHVVKKGETLGGIARKYHVTTAQIMRWNKIKDAHRLGIGQKLRIERR